MRRSAAVLAIVLTAALLVGASASSAAVLAKKQKLPKDACALLTDAQVGKVVPSATAQPQPSTALQVSCFWTGGPDPATHVSLALGVDKLTIPVAQAKAELKANAKKSGVKPAKAVGDFAYQSAPSPPFSHVAVLVGKLLLSIDFSAGAPVTADQAAKVLATAKVVAKKI